MGRYVALLRGINVGTAKRIAMADLRALAEDLGFDRGRTLLNSGNVVLDSGLAAKAVAARLHSGIADRFGMDVAVVVRTAAQLAAVVERNPFADIATDPKRSSVTFLDAKLPPRALADVDPSEFEPERFELNGTELYLWLPGGPLDSPLLKVLTKGHAEVTGTNRNWNTVEKLHAMALAD